MIPSNNKGSVNSSKKDNKGSSAVKRTSSSSSSEKNKKPNKRKRKSSTISSSSNSTASTLLQQQQQPPPFDLFDIANKNINNDDANNTNSNLHGVINLLKGRKNILVLVGAGISVSCGIPDFRSKSSGLYNTLNVDDIDMTLTCPEDLFDYDFFIDNPQPFYKFVKTLYYPPTAAATTTTTTPNKAATTTTKKNDNNETERKITTLQPSNAHKFLAMLQKNNMLLRVYTQNMDGLEQIAGVSPNKVVYAHGSLVSPVVCCKCRNKVSPENIQEHIKNGAVPLCQRPININNNKKAGDTNNGAKKKEEQSGITSEHQPPRKTSNSNNYSNNRAVTRQKAKEEEGIKMNGSITRMRRQTINNEYLKREEKRSQENKCGGILKPGITFFGEKLNNNVASRLQNDRSKCDALIVMGTSLQVSPMSKVIQYLRPSIPRILINRTIVSPPKRKVRYNNSEDDQEDDMKDSSEKKKLGQNITRNSYVSGNSDKDDDEEDFRKDYIFDAHLLGFCDDVTKELVKEMFENTDSININNKNNDNEISKQGKGNHRSSEVSNRSSKQGKLISSITDNDDEFFCNMRDEWNNVHGNIPMDRTFLFPGATLSTMAKSNSHHDNDGEELEYEEIAHCDGCSGRITGKIRKCVDCFDFDLCSKCYPSLSKTHYNGKHSFAIE